MDPIIGQLWKDRDAPGEVHKVLVYIEHRFLEERMDHHEQAKAASEKRASTAIQQT